MKNLLLLTSCSILLFLVQGCGPDTVEIQKTTSLDLNFKAVFENPDLPLILEKPYDYADGMGIKFSHFSFYLSEITLLGDSENTELKDVALMTFNHTDSAEAKAGQTISISNIPVGDYTGIHFTIGVTADLNKTKPDDYGSSHPLSITENYSSEMDSYIFSKIEGLGDVDGLGDFSQTLTYHTSTSDALRERFIYSNLLLEVDKKESLTFNIDVQRILMNQASYIDIKNFPETHSSNNVAKALMDNFVEAITLKE